MHRGIIIYLSILIGLALTAGGSYFIIENLIEPQGFMFEGIMAAGLGITLLMSVVVASTIGKAIMLFGEILEQTTKLNQEIVKQSQPQSISSIFQGMIPPGSNMTVTNLNTGETSSNKPELGKMSEMIFNAMAAGLSGKTDKELKDMSIKELEKLLAKAIKDDDYEDAAEISAILKEKKNPGSGESENNS